MASAESRPGRIGPINLDAKQTGERKAGNPHLAFDVAGTGNVARSRCCDTRRRKGEDNREHKHRPKPARQSSTLLIGGIEETSASFEARSAPRAHPTERLGLKVPGPTRQNSPSRLRDGLVRCTPGCCRNTPRSARSLARGSAGRPAHVCGKSRCLASAAASSMVMKTAPSALSFATRSSKASMR